MSARGAQLEAARGLARRGSPDGLRVLIICADIGEGHVTVAEALATKLRARREVAEVILSTHLGVLGERLGAFLMRGFHRHLERRWTYDWTFRLMMGFPPARWFGLAALYLLAGAPLARFVRGHDPDVVVSEYPVINAVLGDLRARGRLQVPVCGSISDPAGLHFWARPGIDVHLLSWAEAKDEVERIAGAGRAQPIIPPVAPGFLSPPRQPQARRALDLPVEGELVVVSGGGWGVGDLEGAIEVALERPRSTVVALAGRNDALSETLSRRFVAEPRLRVLGFTGRMPELLAAADVLVHSTGGTTGLEARVCGCPLINYGFPIGHVRAHIVAMRELGIAPAAKTPAELREVLDRVLAAARHPPLPLHELADPADVVIAQALRGAPAGDRRSASDSR